MSDIDEELLALAGDASSDEESAPQSRSASRSPARSSNNSTARKAPATSRSRDMSPRGSTPGSERSAPMDESDSESDAGTPNFGEGDRYPLEGKYKDEEDRAEILAMPEIKREELLAERASQTERDRQNRALRQLLQARDQEKKMQEKKRKAGDDDIEEGNRKTSRQRTKVGGGRVGEQSSGIDSLKKARDEKADRQRRRQEDLDRNGPRQVDQHQSEDELSDDEYAWDAPKRNEPTKIQSTPATLGDIERLRVGRSFFARFAFYPGYEEALKGTYARVCIGLDRSGKNQLYRMAEIIGFVEGRPYAMEKPNGQTMMVDTYVNLAHGKAVKEWPMTNCSNSRFTEEEWKKLQDTCEYEKVKIPTHETLAEKAKELYAFEHRTWTDAEITARLQRTGTLNLRTNMTGIAKWKRELALARDAGDKSKVAELEGIIAKLEPPKAILRGNSGLKNSTPVSTPTRKPIIKHETDDERLHRETARIQKENEAAIAREANLRRMREKTAAMRATKAGIASGTATPKEEAEVKKDEEVEALTNQVKQLQAQAAEKKVFGQLNKELNDDDVIGALDFDIDIEI